MSLAGTASISQNDLFLLATNCPPSKSGIFFYGTAQDQAPFGDGNPAASADIRQFGVRVLVT